MLEQHHHNGPTFDYWRTRIAASVGAILIDDLMGKEQVNP